MTDFIIDGPLIAGDVGSSSVIHGNTNIGGSSNTVSATNESVNIGGSSSSKSLSGTGSASVGGVSVTPTQTGVGSVTVGGSSVSSNVAGNGGVAIAAAGLFGSGTGDVNLVAIGGSGTTMGGSGSIAAGPSTLTKLYSPANPKMYVMGSPVITTLRTAFTTPGTLTAAAVSGGVIEFTTTAGAYTMPTTSALCTEILDTTLTAFTGTPRHIFSVTFYNNSGGACTVATGTGQTLTNGSSPFSVANGGSMTWKCWFTSPTAMLIEIAQVATSVVITGLTPNSFLYSGTAGALTTTAAPTNGQLLIGSTGVAPVLGSLTGSASVTVTNGAGTITLAVSEPFYTTNSRAIISGTGNTFTAVSSTSGGGIFGGSTNTCSIAASTGGVIVGGKTMNITIANSGSAGTAVGGTARTVTLNADGAVSIAAAGTVGAAADTNLVLIGGTNTTILGGGSVSIGPSTQTVRYQPANPKLYLKDNPVSSMLNTTFTTPGTLTAASISGGVVQFTTTAGAYTMPTTAQLCTEILDSSATAFTGNPRHVFNVTFYNTSGGACSVALGTGQTLTNGVSPFSVANNNSMTWKCWFTSPTAMLIEIAQVATSVIAGLTANSFVYSGTAGVLTTTSAPTNGQLLIGSTGVAPALGSLTGSASVTVTNGAGTITLATSEPFYTSNTRAIISGTGNTLTNIASNCAGGIFGGSSTNVTITATSGSVAVGGANTTAVPNLGGSGNVIVGSSQVNGASISGSGNVVVGSSSNACVISSNGNAVVGSQALSATISTNNGNAIVGSASLAALITGTGCAIIGSNNMGATATVSGSGNVIVGSITAFAATSPFGSTSGNVVIGSQGALSTFSANGAVLIGSNACTTSIGGVGSVILGGASNAGSTSATGSVIIGGQSYNALLSGLGAVVVGSQNSLTPISSSGGVIVGGVSSTVTSSLSGSGAVICGGSTSSAILSANGGVLCGGFTNSGTTSGTGSTVVGGHTCAVTITGAGSVAIGGQTETVTITADGSVAIAATGTVGSAANQSGNILIGGSGTTLASAGNISIGTSTTTQTFGPTNAQLFLKSNPMTAWTTTPINNGAVAAVALTAIQLVNGFINRQSGTVAPNFTFPTASSVYNLAVDNTGGTFALNIMFPFLIVNSGGTGVITLTTNTGFGTLQGTTGTIAAGASRAGWCILTANNAGILYFFA